MRSFRSGEVHGDENVRPFGPRVRDQPSVDLVGAGKNPGDFEQAGHRQTAEIAEQIGACGAQPVAAEAADRGRRLRRANLARKLASVQIAGGLAAGDHDPHGLPLPDQLGRANTEASSGTLYWKLRITRVMAGSPGWRMVTEKATFRPLTSR